jgi:hypothetical protein
MRKITKEEAKSFTVKKGNSSAVRTALLHLQPGEILLIEKKDWKPKDGPGQMVGRVTKKPDCVLSSTL